jgi:hypothetical protein
VSGRSCGMRPAGGPPASRPAELGPALRRPGFCAGAAGNSSQTGIGFGPDPPQPVRRGNLVRSRKAGIMPRDQSPG